MATCCLAVEVEEIERDHHPTNRGTLCPKGAALLDFVHAETRLKYPMIRKPGSDKFEQVSWEAALDRIARLMKDDRDKNFVSKNNDGVTVNRWLTTGFPCGVGDDQRNGVLHLQGGAQHRHFDVRQPGARLDTAPRWPVWPQLSAAAQ
jgi:anaerobic selenocysteine-containing dehydrogenase